MQNNGAPINEQNVALAFSNQAGIFDALYSNDAIIQFKRQRVWDHVQKLLSPASQVLELNSGTGEDALWFAREGHQLHATDISKNMQLVLERKVKANQLEARISNELCSFTELDKLGNKGPYDMIFSNFAGLNCTGQLDKVLFQCSTLLKPGGIITLVLLPRFCLWEFLLIFKGMFKTATRRLLYKNGSPAKILDNHFKCWYYQPSYVTNCLKENFKLLQLEGLCTIVPPSYISNFAEKHPRKFEWLKKKENENKDRWPWKYIGDYYIISLQKKSTG